MTQIKRYRIEKIMDLCVYRLHFDYTGEWVNITAWMHLGDFNSEQQALERMDRHKYNVKNVKDTKYITYYD